MIEPLHIPKSLLKFDYAKLERRVAATMALPVSMIHDEIAVSQNMAASFQSMALATQMATGRLGGLKKIAAQYLGSTMQRMLLPTYEVGARVLWLDNGVRRPATVSQAVRDVNNWAVWIYHLRLDEPVTGPGWRRWAYAASADDLRPLNAVMLLSTLV